MRGKGAVAGAKLRVRCLAVGTYLLALYLGMELASQSSPELIPQLSVRAVGEAAPQKCWDTSAG